VATSWWNDFGVDTVYTSTAHFFPGDTTRPHPVNIRGVRKPPRRRAIYLQIAVGRCNALRFAGSETTLIQDTVSSSTGSVGPYLGADGHDHSRRRQSLSLYSSISAFQPHADLSSLTGVNDRNRHGFKHACSSDIVPNGNKSTSHHYCGLVPVNAYAV
jgi:hypothetical protein